jgi:hypothetical protein
MSLQKKTATPSSVKLEMTREQLEMMVYMLGAIDLRTEPKTLEIAMDLRRKLEAAQKFIKAPKERPTDKYGKPMTDEEIEKAQEVAALAAPAQAEVEKV